MRFKMTSVHPVLFTTSFITALIDKIRLKTYITNIPYMIPFWVSDGPSFLPNQSNIPTPRKKAPLLCTARMPPSYNVKS